MLQKLYEQSMQIDFATVNNNSASPYSAEQDANSALV